MAVIELEVSEQLADRWRTLSEAERRTLSEQMNRFADEVSDEKLRATSEKREALGRFFAFCDRAPGWGHKFNRAELYHE